MKNIFKKIKVFLNKTWRPHTFSGQTKYFSSEKFSGTQCLWSPSKATPAIGTLRNPAEKGMDSGLYVFEKHFFNRNIVGIPTQSGFGLLEVIVAVGLWVILAAAGILMTTGSLRINLQTTDNDQANLLAMEGLDGVRTIKKIGWTTPFLATSCVTGCGVAMISGTWGFLGTNNVIGKYTRQVLVTPVNRDGSGNIIASGGAIDPNTYKVESKVTWSRSPVVTGNISLVSYLTNYSRRTIGDWALPLVDGSYDFGGNSDVVGLTLFGNYLYIIRPASTNDFVVVDVSNTSTPVVVGSLSISGTGVTGITTDGSYIYLSDANNSAELRIINVTSPTAPTATSNFDVPGNSNANGLFQVGNLIYITRNTSAGAEEFVIIDVTNKTSPVRLGGLDLAGTANKVSVIGNYAYVASADNLAELQIINVVNPVTPTLVGTLDLLGNNDALSISGFGSTILVGRNGGTMNIVNVTNPAAPTLISTYMGSGGDINAISLGNGNNYAFLATTSTTQEFQVVDITNTSLPVLLGSMNLSAGLDWVVYDPTRDRAFIGSRDNADEIFILKPSP